MKKKNIRQQFADTCTSLGHIDNRLTVVVGDISHGIMQNFAKAFPERYFNIGILEPTMVSVVAGMSKMGQIPVVHTIAPFLIERSFEQIKLDLIYHNLECNIVSVGSAFDYSNLGCTHHCYGDFALLKTLPDVDIFYPGSPLEFDELFKKSYDNGKVSYFRIPGSGHSFDFDKKDITVSEPIKICEGEDLTIVATGPHLNTAELIRNMFYAHGKTTEILYAHTINPISDETYLNSFKKTKRIVVIEEHMEKGGFGDDLLRKFFSIENVQFLSASIPNTFVRAYGTYEELCETVGLTAPQIFERINNQFSFD